MFSGQRCSQNRRGGSRWQKIVRLSSPRASAFSGILLALSACSHATSTTTAPSAPITLTSGAPQDRPATAWAFIDGIAVPIRLRVPFAAEWERQEKGPSFRLRHVGTQIRIMIRLWAASRLVSEEQCLDELALVEPEIAQLNPSMQQSRVIPLPADAASPSIAHTDNGVADPPSDGLVDSRRFEPSREFLGHLRVFVRPSLGELGTTGIVLGVAAGIGRCLAFHAVTAVGGAQANEQVADRLVWLVDGVAKSLNVRAAEQRPTRNR